MPSRRHYAVSLEQAAQASPTLSSILGQAKEANARLKAIEGLLPPALKDSVQAGPIEGSTWLLLIKNAAAASKVRQLLPALEAHLRTRGWDVQRIQIKVLNSHPWQSPQ